MSELRLSPGVAPAIPPAGQITVYSKGDKKLYFMDDTGLETAASGGASPGAWSNVVYLDVAGNDGTGARGDASKPFLTLQAALNACLDDDLLSVGPGLFFQGAVSTVWPAALTQIAIRGAGRDATILGGNGGATILNPNAPGMDRFSLEDITVATKGALGVALDADGTGFAGAYLNTGLFVRNVNLQADIVPFRAQYVIDGALENVRCSGTFGFTFATSNFNTLRGLVVTDATQIAIAWNDDDLDKPAAGRAQLRFFDSSLGQIVLAKQPSIYVAQGCWIKDVGATVMDEAATTMVPSIDIHCELDSVELTTPSGLPDTTVAMNVNFDGIIIRNNGGGKFNIGVNGAAVNFQDVMLRGASAPSQFAPAGATNITARSGVHLYSDVEGFCNLGVVGTGTHTPRKLHFRLPYVGPVGPGQLVAFGIVARIPPTAAFVTFDAILTGFGAVHTLLAGSCMISASGIAGGMFNLHVVWDV